MRDMACRSFCIFCGERDEVEHVGFLRWRSYRRKRPCGPILENERCRGFAFVAVQRTANDARSCLWHRCSWDKWPKLLSTCNRNLEPSMDIRFAFTERGEIREGLMNRPDCTNRHSACGTGWMKEREENLSNDVTKCPSRGLHCTNKAKTLSGQVQLCRLCSTVRRIRH